MRTSFALILAVAALCVAAVPAFATSVPTDSAADVPLPPPPPPPPTPDV